jgi:hypothetical protein
LQKQNHSLCLPSYDNTYPAILAAVFFHTGFQQALPVRVQRGFISGAMGSLDGPKIIGSDRDI